jgi:hypothetical protein
MPRVGGGSAFFVRHRSRTVKNKRYIFYAVVGILLLLYLKPLFWRYDCTPWAAYRARHRIDLVHPGMTESEVFQTLGLSFYGFHAHVSGSGNPHSYPANYLLWPGVILYCRWDLTTNPPIARVVRFKQSLDDR